MGIPAFPVDTHIYRVTGRIGLRPSKMSVEKAHPYLEERIPEEAYYDLHLNLIRLGRASGIVIAARFKTCVNLIIKI